MGMKTFTLVQAPQVPSSEREALEKHYRETVLDPDYILAVNYEIRIDVLEKKPTDKIIVTAPGIPASEIIALRERVEAALDAEKPEDKFVVVNYEVAIFTMPHDPTVVSTYGEIVDPDPEGTKIGHEEVEHLMNDTFSTLIGFKEEDTEDK